MSEQEPKDPTIEEIESFPLDPLPMEKKYQEPKIENSAEKVVEMSLTYSEWQKVLTGMTAYGQELCL